MALKPLRRAWACMGVLENELGEISIPYMEEDPLYPHQLKEHLETFPEPPRERIQVEKSITNANGSYSSKEEKEYTDV